MKTDSSCLEQDMFRPLRSLWEILSEIHINEPPALYSVEGMLKFITRNVNIGC